MNGQSTTHSWFEAWANILVGYGINFAANLWVFPLYGWELSVGQNLQLGVIYTAISLLRSFGMRRLFNWITVRREA